MTLFSRFSGFSVSHDPSKSCVIRHIFQLKFMIRKTATRLFDTFHDLKRSLNLVQPLLKAQNVPIWRHRESKSIRLPGTGGFRYFSKYYRLSPVPVNAFKGYSVVHRHEVYVGEEEAVEVPLACNLEPGVEQLCTVERRLRVAS